MNGGSCILTLLDTEDFKNPLEWILQLQSCSTYRHLRPPTEQYRQSFFVTTIIDWNNLSEACVNADTITAFKAQLRPLPHP